jgi:SAM-dependent methyltransferase
MSIFGEEYAEIYNALNAGKDYSFEANFCLEIYRKHTNLQQQPNSILDLACGSGKHLAEFDGVAQRCGVDLSAEMIAVARGELGEGVELLLGNINTLDLQREFDLVTSLFHVLSYQFLVEDAVLYMKSIARHLRSGGIAVVDFWHRPAWDLDPPGTRERSLSVNGRQVSRVSRGVPNYLTGQVDIDISVEVLGTDNSPQRVHEVHYMRAFTIAEVELLAKLAGLSLKHCGTWGDINADISRNDWIGVAVLEHSR